MRVVITGATGNVGTSLVEALAVESAITSVLGLARRLPEHALGGLAGKTEWVAADITTTDLSPCLRGADVVVHLAWLLQPSHDPVRTWRTNVVGGIRVFRAVAEAGVPALVYASSVGAYSPGPKDSAVDESWPTDGWPVAAYCREKAYVERVLDSFEHEHTDIRVVRLRPGFVLKREASSQQRRLFAGPLLPRALVRPGLIPVVPDIPGLRFQAVHSADLADAYRLAITTDARGAFNVAADPVLDPTVLATLLDARTVRTPAWAVGRLLAAAWWMHLVPASPRLFDAVLRLPVMDTTRIRTELGWSPQHSAVEAVQELLHGLREGKGLDTPPLAPKSGGRARVREFTTGIGQRP
jgi:UDP-glucose 4-epimerase